MTVREVCERIELQPQLAEPVNAFADEFDFETLRLQLEKLKSRKTSEAALEEIRALLGEDERNIKILACTLKCAAEQYDNYRKKGISSRIFTDTMRCMTRFAGECVRRTGIYACDREWWTVRQISMVLFRLGELEFEMDTENGNPVIHVHIPSDAKITEENCDAAFAQAKEFFKTYYPEYVQAEYICDSWLLAPVLKKFLPETSKIIRFQNRFDIYKEDLEDTSFTEWLYHTKEYVPVTFPEDTSLQRDIKKYVLGGGRVGCGYGRLRR